MPANGANDLHRSVSWLCKAMGSDDVALHWRLPASSGMVVVREGDCDGRVCVDENVLTVRYLHPGDSGRYTCVAKNKYGQDQRQVALKVEVRKKEWRPFGTSHCGGISYNPPAASLLFLLPDTPACLPAVDLRPYAHFGQLYKGSKRARESVSTILHLSLWCVRARVSTLACDSRAEVSA